MLFSQYVVLVALCRFEPASTLRISKPEVLAGCWPEEVSELAEYGFWMPECGTSGTQSAFEVSSAETFKQCEGPNVIDYQGESFHSPPGNGKARGEFLKILESGNVTDTMFTSRHTCTNHHCIHNVPETFHMFDCYQALTEQRGKMHTLCKKSNPSSLLCNPYAGMKDCMKLIDELPELKNGEKRMLALGGADAHLSTVIDKVKIIQRSRKFSRILFEAKDIVNSDIGTFPTGLNNWYAQHNGNDNIMHAIQGASLQRKDKGVFAAWGGVWKFLDSSVPSRTEAVEFVRTSCLANRTMVNPHEYFAEMARHRFLLAPSGAGVQTPKLLEALLVLTIPIVQRNPAFVDLVENYGWPLALVDKWDEITPDKLVEWHRNLSPRLDAFRSHLTAVGMFTDIMRQ